MQFYVSCFIVYFSSCTCIQSEFTPRGGGEDFQIRRWFGGKIWGKVRPSSQNKRKNLGSSVTKRRKSWEKVPILGSYLKFRGQNLGHLSFICLEAKFGAPTRISEAKFGAKPPDLLIWKYPPGIYFRCERCDICVDLHMIYNYMLRMAFLIEFAGGFIMFL